MSRNSTIHEVLEAIDEARYKILHCDDAPLQEALDTSLEMLTNAYELAEEVGETLDDLPDEHDE